MMQVILLESESLEELEEKINSSIRKSEGSYEILDIKFIPAVKESFIYYFAQITYKHN